MKLFKLNLRDLFWLALVVGLALGWSIEHALHTRQRKMIRTLNAIGVDVDGFERMTTRSSSP